MPLLSGVLVVALGLCLIGVALLVVIRPVLAERFLRSFASSARAHYTEQAIRLVFGAALVIFAPSMWYPGLFEGLGWLIIVTSVGLLVLPWQWHHKFATWTIPMVIRYMKLYALGSFALGAIILYGASRAVLA